MPTGPRDVSLQCSSPHGPQSPSPSRSGLLDRSSGLRLFLTESTHPLFPPSGLCSEPSLLENSFLISLPSVARFHQRKKGTPSHTQTLENRFPLSTSTHAPLFVATWDAGRRAAQGLSEGHRKQASCTLSLSADSVLLINKPEVSPPTPPRAGTLSAMLPLTHSRCSINAQGWM